MKQEEVKSAKETLKVFDSDHRLRILHLLLEDGEIRRKDLKEKLGFRYTENLTIHLNKLLEANLVYLKAGRPDGQRDNGLKTAIYGLNKPRYNKLKRAITLLNGK